MLKVLLSAFICTIGDLWERSGTRSAPKFPLLALKWVAALKLELREVTLLFRRFPPFFVVFPCSACLPPLLSTNFPAIPFELSTISPFPAFCLFALLISVQPPGFFTRIPGISRFSQI